MSFVSRQIVATITLNPPSSGDVGSGTTFDGKNNTATLDGYWIAATITKGGAPSWDAAEVRIYGLSESLMNKLTRLGKPLNFTRTNLLTLTAGDDVSGMSIVFQGNIQVAYADFDASPDVCLVISAFVGPVPSTKPIAPTSFPNGGSAATMASQIASLMGLHFINEGVSTTLPPSYFAGSAQQQMNTLADAGNFQWIPNGGSGLQSVVIWPKGQSQGAMGPLIGPTSGLVDYPKYTDQGASITSIYQPGINIGTAFTLQSSLTSAVGTWFAYQVSLDLECNNPKGSNPWFMVIDAARAPGVVS